MLKHIFVAGTDTAVGKTVVARALLQNLAAAHISAVGYKPIAYANRTTAEGACNNDALILQSSASCRLDYAQINPIAIAAENAGFYTGEPIDYDRMSQGLQSLTTLADTVVIDGNGGWRTLLADYRPYSQWVVSQQLPVILVIGIQLGCINHALLTAQAIIDDGLPLLGWVANRINPGLAHYAEVLNVLRHNLPSPQLGELPYLPRAEQRDLAGFLDLSELISLEQAHIA